MMRVHGRTAAALAPRRRATPPWGWRVPDRGACTRWHACVQHACCSRPHVSQACCTNRPNTQVPPLMPSRTQHWATVPVPRGRGSARTASARRRTLKVARHAWHTQQHVAVAHTLKRQTTRTLLHGLSVAADMRRASTRRRARKRRQFPAPPEEKSSFPSTATVFVPKPSNLGPRIELVPVETVSLRPPRLGPLRKGAQGGLNLGVGLAGLNPVSLGATDPHGLTSSVRVPACPAPCDDTCACPRVACWLAVVRALDVDCPARSELPLRAWPVLAATAADAVGRQSAVARTTQC